jgi:hypothetical protein
MSKKPVTHTPLPDPLATGRVFNTLPSIDSRGSALHASRLRLLYPRDEAPVPDYAALLNGEPYTGTAYGTVGIVDWSGAFKDGLRDGMFTVTLGDRMTRTTWYREGEEVQSPARDITREV